MDAAREAIEQVGVGHPGTTNTQSFVFCRALKRISNDMGYEFDQCDLMELAELWFDRWSHAMGGSDLADVESRICASYPKIKVALGDNPQFVAAARMAKCDIPDYPTLTKFDEHAKRLVVYMRELHRVVGGEFHVPLRKLAVHIGLCEPDDNLAQEKAAPQVLRWLDALSRRGIIKCVKQGVRATRQSNHYIYTWHDL